MKIVIQNDISELKVKQGQIKFNHDLKRSVIQEIAIGVMAQGMGIFAGAMMGMPVIAVPAIVYGTYKLNVALANFTRNVSLDEQNQQLRAEIAKNQ